MDFPHTPSSVITINILKTRFFDSEVEAQDLKHWSHQVDDFNLIILFHLKLLLQIHALFDAYMAAGFLPYTSHIYNLHLAEHGT